MHMNGTDLAFISSNISQQNKVKNFGSKHLKDSLSAQLIAHYSAPNSHHNKTDVNAMIKPKLRIKKQTCNCFNNHNSIGNKVEYF